MPSIPGPGGAFIFYGLATRAREVVVSRLFLVSFSSNFPWKSLKLACRDFGAVGALLEFRFAARVHRGKHESQPSDVAPDCTEQQISEKMSRFLRNVILCGCSSRSGVDGQTFVDDESVADDGCRSIEFPVIDEQTEDVARHLDLSAIKFIDDEEADGDDDDVDDGTLGNGTRVVLVEKKFAVRVS